MVRIWDGEWYKRIALHGYPLDAAARRGGHGRLQQLGVLPAVPHAGAGRACVTGLSFSVAASVVNLLAGAGCGPGDLAAVRRCARATTGWPCWPSAFWCVLPSAPVLQVAYTEALAALLLAGTLLLLVRRHYLWAVPVVLLLGLTRAVAATAGASSCSGTAGCAGGPARYDPWPRRQLASWAGAAAGHRGVGRCCGRPSSGCATGVPDAFFQTQAAWGQRPADGPFLPWLHLGLGRARADRRRPAARRSSRPSGWRADQPAHGVAGAPSCGSSASSTRCTCWRSCGRSPACGGSCCSTCRSRRRWPASPPGARSGTSAATWWWRVAAAAVLGLAAHELVDRRLPDPDPVGRLAALIRAGLVMAAGRLAMADFARARAAGGRGTRGVPARARGGSGRRADRRRRVQRAEDVRPADRPRCTGSR